MQPVFAMFGSCMHFLVVRAAIGAIESKQGIGATGVARASHKARIFHANMIVKTPSHQDWGLLVRGALMACG